MMQSPSGLGFNSWGQNLVTNNSTMSNFLSVYNNNSTRIGLNVQSFTPSPNSFLNVQAREFQNYAYAPVMQHLGQLGAVGLPASFQNINPQGVAPTMSELTNWGGNPMAQPAMFMPSPWMMFQQPSISLPQSMRLNQPVMGIPFFPRWM